MRGPLRDGEHLIRVSALFAAGLVGFLLVQRWLVPPEFGKYGHFRPGALADNRGRAIAYAGRTACADCHTDVPELLKAGKHARVGCEACHGPLARHIEDADAHPAKRPDPRAVCLVCHTANVAKPARFPQIVPQEHSPEGPCVECHVAHNPGATPEASR
jgi:cytochrome c7-like protein